jgi:hypothetical protein
MWVDVGLGGGVLPLDALLILKFSFIGGKLKNGVNIQVSGVVLKVDSI